MYQLKKNTLSAAAAFFTGGLFAILWSGASVSRLVQPLVSFGNFLRSLSLGSGVGNIAAWAIVIGLSCLPLLGALRKNRSKADLLLLLSGAEIFAALYYLVNPSEISQALKWGGITAVSNAWAFTAAWCIAATLICWVLLRLLKIIAKKPAAVLPSFLFFTAVIYAFLLGFSGIQSIKIDAAELMQGNTQKNLLFVSLSMLAVVHILALIPDILGVFTIFLAGKLALGLEKEPFSAETIALAESVSKKAVLIAEASLLLTVLGNALQLLCFSKLLRININISVPLLTLVLCGALILLCKYFHRAKAISDDNASII